MAKYYLAAFLGVLLTAIGQLCFKIGANHAAAHSLAAIYANPCTLLAYAMLFTVTLLNLFAYRALPLKLAVAILPFTNLLVGLFSFVFLRERATPIQLLGAGIIITGIVIYNLKPAPGPAERAS